MFLPFSYQQIEEMGASNTVKEIMQQPELWKKVYEIVLNKMSKISQFFQDISANHTRARFIFTGAGTSAFVGDIVVPYLRKNNSHTNWDFQAIATTDLVSSPSYYFYEDIPTILVSFARSGNSPESVAAVELGEKNLSNFYQIVITCNENGKLAKKARNDSRALLIQMPNESNDLGFAMTSSFTCMMLASLLVFQYEKLDSLKTIVDKLYSLGESFLKQLSLRLEDIFEFNFQRIIYLGSGILGGIARESALKVLELTSGQVISMNETPLGFRHGPKTILNDHTLVVQFLSSDPYTRKYDIDLLKELHKEKLNSKVVSVDLGFDQTVMENSHCNLQVAIDDKLEDIYLGFIYVLFAQALSVKKSIQLGLEVDNPCTNGMVNRVVQGVKIHSL
ncbi:SIS domain-containing protein [Neobacillus sp. CF12]|uniref:SIS domain-containing protein n=1 Tax=Neobacillus sp. CF12 TaxID=3055864 RepID=UPI0025A2FF88|nr:SIS domain-containing protein [Neobacillus sp. CF12]MDM5326268.1 SIS domain-containing protein [Neobacillus sp. CF12]